MMPKVATIVLALFQISVVTAFPQLLRRGLPGAVYTCTAPDFRGECQWNAPSSRCMIQGPAGHGLMSIGPDPDGTCTLFENHDCTGKELRTITFPGIAGGLPTFAAFKCMANNQGRAPANATSSKTIDPFADPRLAGGTGSVERKKTLNQIQQMEADGFKRGLIGLKKGVYY